MVVGWWLSVVGFKTDCVLWHTGKFNMVAPALAVNADAGGAVCENIYVAK